MKNDHEKILETIKEIMIERKELFEEIECAHLFLSHLGIGGNHLSLISRIKLFTGQKEGG